MHEKKQDQELTTLSFQIKTTDLEKYRVCVNKIHEKIDQNKAVPANLIKEYLGYMTSSNQQERKELYEKCRRAATATINYFSNIKEYQFINSIDQTKFHFGKLIQKSLEFYVGSIWMHKMMKDVTEKKKCIQTLFEALAIYSRPWNRSSNKEGLFISHYKKTVIAAYLTHQLGFYVLNPDAKDKYTLNDLYKAGWDCVKHLSKSELFQKSLEPIMSDN